LLYCRRRRILAWPDPHLKAFSSGEQAIRLSNTAKWISLAAKIPIFDDAVFLLDQLREPG
jgi:hypothetical protein